MDGQSEFVLGSEVCVAVLGRGLDFVLIDISQELDEAVTEDAIKKGFAYCGALAVKNGEAGARCEPHPDCVFTMMHAGMAFAQLVADMLRAKPKGDGVEWLTALYSLPDPRG
jgi:hypothetical protein